MIIIYRNVGNISKQETKCENMRRSSGVGLARLIMICSGNRRIFQISEHMANANCMSEGSKSIVHIGFKILLPIF